MRKYVLALTAVLALVIAASAGAMTGRFDPTGKITANGRAAHVSGPSGLESDEAGATVYATVTQGGCTGSGTSAYTTGTKWEATASGCTFHAGSAYVTATATITLKNGGSETYWWDQTITLK